jgi:hypothetical protein
MLMSNKVEEFFRLKSSDRDMFVAYIYRHNISKSFELCLELDIITAYFYRLWNCSFTSTNESKAVHWYSCQWKPYFCNIRIQQQVRLLL